MEKWGVEITTESADGHLSEFLNSGLIIDVDNLQPCVCNLCKSKPFDTSTFQVKSLIATLSHHRYTASVPPAFYQSWLAFFLSHPQGDIPGREYVLFTCLHEAFYYF